MTTEKPGIGRAMMRYAGGVKKEMKQAQGARAKMSVAGSGAAGAPMALLAESAKDLLKPKGTFWGIFTKNKSVMGINLSVGSLLKQSQVFTSSVSSILQIIGALVDVFIAPFLIPLIIPLLKKMASFIGPVREWAQALAEKWVPKIQKFFSDIWSGDGSFWSKIGETAKGMLMGAFKATGLYDWYMDADVTSVIGAFRESINLIVKLLQSLGILEAPGTVKPHPLTPTIQDSWTITNTILESKKSEKAMKEMGGVRGSYSDYSFFGGGMDYGGSQVQPGMSRIFAGTGSNRQGGMIGAGMADPNDISLYNSQNDGGTELKKDKRKASPTPSATYYFGYDEN